MDTASFRFAYDHGPIRFGAGSVGGLGDELAALDCDRALVVTGESVGATDAVVEPVRRGLGDRLAGVFAGTTPEKRLDTAFAVVDAMVERDADALVGVGGGSSLDVATAASVLAVTDRSRDESVAAFAETGTIPLPDEPPVPMAAVPTTLAGADLSPGAGITLAAEASPSGERVDGGVDDPRLMPAVVCADPELVATTPATVLHASAMNGFDKGVESLYAANATPFTDATAVRGLGLLRSGLPALGAGRRDAATMERVVAGNLLVQYGTAQPDGRTMSIIHAFGHGLAKGYGVQQGVAHAVAAPHVLRYVFEHVDGRRHLLADALGVPADLGGVGVGDGVVDAVAAVRDALGLPSRLRDVDGPQREEFPAVAETIVGDRLLANAPPDLDPTVGEIEAVLAETW